MTNEKTNPMPYRAADAAAMPAVAQVLPVPQAVPLLVGDDARLERALAVLVPAQKLRAARHVVRRDHGRGHVRPGRLCRTCRRGGNSCFCCRNSICTRKGLTRPQINAILSHDHTVWWPGLLQRSNGWISVALFS